MFELQVRYIHLTGVVTCDLAQTREAWLFYTRSLSVTMLVYCFAQEANIAQPQFHGACRADVRAGGAQRRRQEYRHQAALALLWRHSRLYQNRRPRYFEGKMRQWITRQQRLWLSTLSRGWVYGRQQRDYVRRKICMFFVIYLLFLHIMCQR